MRNLLSSITPTNTLYKNYIFNVSVGVVSPNTDTLYGIAVCDLSYGESVYITIPETTRYYSLQFIDCWCRNFSYLYNTSPSGVYKLQYESSGRDKDDKFVIGCPGKLCLVLCRVYANYYDPEDIRLADEVMLRMMITGKQGENPLQKTEVCPKMSPLDIRYFLKRAQTLNGYQQIIKPGVLSRLLNNVHLLNECFVPFSQGQASIKTVLSSPNYSRNFKLGWTMYTADTAKSLFDFAIIQWQGLYANDYQASLYFFNSFDTDYKRYDGSLHSYTLHMKQLPPIEANAFWSINCYDLDGFIPRMTDRILVGTSSNPVPDTDADGGYTLYFIPVNSPLNGKLPQGNILHIPLNPCVFIMRVYSPTRAYFPPTIQILK